MRKGFLERERALITVMVQADNPDRIKTLIDKSVPEGAEAFGMQFERMKKEYRRKDVYRDLFSYSGERPVYVTNYRTAQNEGKSDEVLANELLELADCGADLCDVMGDIFDRQPDEVAASSSAIEKQKKLINRLHEKGSKVLMSSHIFKFISPERALEIALEHQSRGADISKIVSGASSVEEELENLKIINMLKENLKIPFLFLNVGQCGIIRRIGGELGCSMYLTVHEYDEFATEVQPLTKDVKAIRDVIKV